MGEVPIEAQGAADARRVPAEPFAQALSDRQLSLVKARLIANLGAAVAAWFTIVASDQSPTGDLRFAALLLDGHLPILVPITEYEAGSSFFIAKYDIYGRRVELSRQDEMSRFSSLAEALLASDVAFRDLKYHSEVYRAEHASLRSPGEKPEEQWLHRQLRGVHMDA